VSCLTNALGRAKGDEMDGTTTAVPELPIEQIWR